MVFRTTMFAAALLFLAASVLAAEPIAYPKKGQSDAQLAKDTAECAAWARQQTGVDPNEVPPKPPKQHLVNGKRIEGAAPGAARGAVSGAIGGPLGAGVGAAVGAGVGAHKSEQAYREEQAQEFQKTVDAHQQRLSTYDAAQAACLEGRGYSVQ